jgi:peroxiredoxin
MTELQDQVLAAEREWLDGWTSGPTEHGPPQVAEGDRAPDLRLLDHHGRERRLSEFWAVQPALIMFWRHFGCGCGVERAERLKAEWTGYLQAGITPVIVSQGEPARADVYRSDRGLPCPVLCDPHHDAYRAYGIGQWAIERVLFDAPAAYWEHSRELGADFQSDRRASGRPPVDDPWRGVAEFIVGTDGRIRFTYRYQHCEDFPDPRLLTTAARLAR